MLTKRIVLCVLLFEANGGWVAQGLEHDISASGPDVERAKRAFERTVSGYLQAARKLQIEPLSNLKQAPDVYWQAWESEAARNQMAERMPSVPYFMLPVVSHEPLPA